MPPGEINPNRPPRDDEFEERTSTRLTDQMLLGPQAGNLRLALLSKLGAGFTKYSEVSGEKDQDQRFEIELNGETYSDSLRAALNRIRRNYLPKYQGSKYALEFLDLLADGQSLDAATSKITVSIQQSQAERGRQKESRIPVALFVSEDLAARANFRSLILTEYNRRNKTNAACYLDMSASPKRSAYKFTITDSSGAQFSDNWNSLLYRVRTAFKLEASHKFTFSFLDLLADGKSVEEAKQEVQPAYEQDRAEKQYKLERRLPPNLFAADDIGARDALRDALVSQYSATSKKSISRYEGIPAITRKGAEFRVKIGDQEYTDNWPMIWYRVKQNYQLNFENKLIFKFLDLLADGKSVEDAKIEVTETDKKSRTGREQRQSQRLTPEMFTASEAAVLRTAVLAEYNKNHKPAATRYEEMVTRHRLDQFEVKINGATYIDNFGLIYARTRNFFELKLQSVALIYRFLDLLADGRGVEEAKIDVEARYEQDTTERAQQKEQRFSVEVFENSPANTTLRTIILDEYSKRSGKTASRYQEMSAGPKNLTYNFIVTGPDGKRYKDNFQSISRKVKIKYDLVVTDRLMFRFLDLLADGTKVDVAKAEILGQAETKKRQEKLETQFQTEVETMVSNEELLRRFDLWVSIFGPHLAVDILYAYNPDYKGVRTDFVRGVIGEYLGDRLVTPIPFAPSNLAFAEKRLLQSTELQEGLYTCLVQACSSYLSRHTAGLTDSRAAARALQDFMIEMGNNVPVDAQDIFIEIIVKVAEYFGSIFNNWKRPENMVESISEGRGFPDISQIINILEIKAKNRLLIADRMGTGKSGSVIAAKEFLGLEQALVIVPANVIPTWQRYLSEKDDGGYFLKGQKPEVLVVSSVEDLTNDDTKQADYVIISQERLSEEYGEALKGLNSEMLIVDEVHQLKSSTGVRSEVLHDIARQFEDRDKYVALLSGTPVPNKISDIAGILKLLYPTDFADRDVKTIAREIINGDITELRAKLLPRMQRKTLAEVVEMPAMHESDVNITLDAWFQQAYEAILQDDNLSSNQKIIALRQILLNPEILELRPPSDNRMDKIEVLEQTIEKHSISDRKKIVVIFNDYIEGVTRGENNLVGQVKLPAGFKYLVIDGETQERENIMNEFNNGADPIVLYLSGKTGSVGINLPGANVVIEYNEPWSKEIKAQQIGRSYRPGLKNDLYVETFITSGSIEEGIHRYIELKDKAVQKLFLGVELTELEKRLLTEDNSIESEDYQVDADLASYYLNSFQDLLAMFRSIKNIGEARFSQFLSKYGERYAGNYEALGDRSYQSNVARLNANIIRRFSVSGKGVVLDLASGPEMLKSKSLKDLQERIVSLDINQAHFFSKSEQAGGVGVERKPGIDRAVVSGMSHLPFAKGSIDIVNLALGLHYTSFRPGQGDFERLQTICEISRVLKTGGRAVITLQHGTDFKNQESFRALVDLAGFEVDPQYTGQAQATNFQAEVYTLVKKEDADFETLVELMKDEKSLAEGFKLRFDSHTRSFKDTRKILEQVTLAEQNIDLQLNETDDKVKAEEQEILRAGELLKQKYNNIQTIPVGDLRDGHFARLKVGDHYILFKNLEQSRGVVLIK